MDDTKTAAPAPAPAKEPKKPSPMMAKNMLMGLGAGVLAVLVLGAGVLALGVYKLGWSGSGTTALLHAIPLPVATVNGNAIPYADFMEDVATLRHFYDAQVASSPDPLPVPTDAQIKENVLQRLIMNELLREAAEKYSITASDEDVETEFGNLVASSGGAAAVEADLKSMYGWEPAQFKKKVLHPFLLQSKLDAALRLDKDLNAVTEQHAKDVLARAKVGEDFAALAKEFSTDPSTAPAGGELGWFEKGVMVPEFETAAFALEPDVVSDLVQSPFGYHIILVHERETEDGEVSRVNASHILFGFMSSDEYLQTQLEAAKISRYVDIPAPEAAPAPSVQY